ncbi:MAG TPA: GMC family oxidoreductase N-terminal domain-containing protein [Beijerinckiaceae bacterium]|nr:GMC family oxidoreductase N-terminal domain-containing protein [Beijerinckiaceae bacterium]
MTAGQQADETFDYIVIGAGSAGSILGNRLSADGKRVLVLEAGGKDNWIWFHIPVGYLFAIGNPRSDWCLRTTRQPGLNGRDIAYPRGKAIGGSSAINAMLYLRGQAADYDGWRQLGLAGWGWDDVLPIFMGHEGHAGGANAFHNDRGPLRVDFARARWEILDAWRDAAATEGIPKTDDFNRGDNLGSSYFQLTQNNGLRCSAAKAFLKPAMNRPNLKVELGAHVERLALNGRRVVGVTYVKDGARRTAGCRIETILSAGAVMSPHLLELSGIGRGDVLQRLGIPLVHELPGVGENLQDHLQLRPMYKVQGVKTLNEMDKSWIQKAWMGLEFVLFRRGPLTMPPSQVGAFARSNPEVATPNVEFHVQPLSLDRFGEPLHSFPAFTTSICNLRPTSRGTIHATSPDPMVAPAIDPNYLSTDEDRGVAVESLRLARRIVAAEPLRKYRPEEFLPGAHLTSDDELVRGAGDCGTTIFHPVGTAKMGIASDRMAVTDERLRVRGMDNLRVIDASIMPRIVSGNTNAPSIMIGEKGAAMVIEDNRG